MSDRKPRIINEDSISKQFGMFALVLGQFAGASAVGVGLGWFLWNKLGFPWWILLVTTLLGLFAASYQVIRYSRTFQSRKEDKR